MRYCEKCGKPLMAGENWYAMKPDYVCCDCSSYPVYHNIPAKNWGDDNDYEEAILARQDVMDC